MKRISILLLVFCTCFALTAWPQAQSRWTTFDVPGAGKGAGQGTQAYDVNPARAITGAYIDSSNVYHGFLRAPDGTITTFDAPGAGAGQGTAGDAINPKGVIVGAYYDSSNVMHGFRRHPDGTFAPPIDVKGAGTGYHQGTATQNINPAGTIAGYYLDSSNAYHTFLLYPNGKIKVDVPGAGKGGDQGTGIEYPEGINSVGKITGEYIDSSNVGHGYIRSPDGTFTKFDVKGAGKGAGQGTNVYGGINAAGYTSGIYSDAHSVVHGFLRSPGGTIAKFDVKGASGTYATTIDSKHAVAGYYYMNGTHGFLRAPHGKITKLDAPGAGPGGTWAYASNPAGAITGYYVDTSNVDHGFLCLP